MELLKLLSTQELIAQIINFLLLLVFMRMFFWQRILKLLDDRKARIAAEYQRIADTQQEIAKMKAEYETHAKLIEEVSRQRIIEAKETSKKIAEEIKKNAYLESEHIIETARRDVKYELAKAKAELKNEIVDLTIKATQHLIGERLTEADDKKLVEDFLKDIPKIEPS
jgi:F-type H+-transporting ATPase subunit b